MLNWWKSLPPLSKLKFIFAAGFVLRMIAAAAIKVDTDEFGYAFDSLGILGGQIPLRAPLQALFLVPSTFLTPSVLSIRLLAVLASSLTIIAVYYLGRRLYNEKAGLIAAAVFALAPFTIFYGSMLFTENLSWLFIAASLYIFVRGWQEKEYWMFAANGILLGAAFLVRETAIVVAAGEMAFILYKNRAVLVQYIIHTGVSFLPFAVLYWILPHMSFAYTNPLGISPWLNKLGIGALFMLEAAPLAFAAGVFLLLVARHRWRFAADNAFALLMFGALAAFYVFVSGKLHLHYGIDLAVVISIMAAAVLTWRPDLWKWVAVCGAASLVVLASFGGFESYYPQKDLNRAADYLRCEVVLGSEVFTANLAVLYLAEMRPTAGITHPALYAIPATGVNCAGCNVAGDSRNLSGETAGGEKYSTQTADLSALAEAGYMPPDELAEYLEENVRFAVIDDWTRHCFFQRNPQLEKFFKENYSPVAGFGGIEVWKRFA